MPKKRITQPRCISVEVSRRKKIDLNILNCISNSHYSCFLDFSYDSNSKNHIFNYKVDDGEKSLSQIGQISREDFAVLMSSLSQVISFCLQHSISFDNVDTSIGNIYYSQNGFRFILIPLESSRDCGAKKFLLKVLGEMRKKNDSIAQVIGGVKCEKDSDACLQLIKMYATTFGKEHNESDFEKYSSSFLIDEGEDSETETTILSNDDLNSYEKQSEAETTILSQDTFAKEDETTLLSENGLQDVLNHSSDVGNENNCEDFDAVTTLLSCRDSDKLSTPQKNNNDLFFQNMPLVYIELNRISTGESVQIFESFFSVGTDSSQVDFFISGSDTISRNHASFIIEGCNCFIVDNCSTNGTVVEGRYLNPYERVEIYNGSIVILGEERFQVFIKDR